LVTIDCTGYGGIKQSLLLNVTTGAGSGSGTTANVYCVLTGRTLWRSSWRKFKKYL